MSENESFLNFCTITDKAYVLKCLALYYSLKANSTAFHLWICCADNETYEILGKMKLKKVSLLPIEEIQDERLLKVKNERKMNEYCWTIKAPLVLHLFRKFKAINTLIYIDGDMFFFSNPAIVLNTWNKESILICRQRASAYTEKRTGIFQAGLIGFRRDANALKCLQWWKERCIEWCYSNFEENRWADQKYLDQWPMLFKNIRVINRAGINAAFWNTRDCRVSKKNNSIYVNQDRLVVYHFSGLSIYNSWEYDLCKYKCQHKNV